ncbi:MAG TPA: Fic/DOC family N-terminal domain-containing protein [Syntrophorhabdaceae bacterium]
MAPVNYHYGKFPPEKVNWADLISLIGPANAAIARYDGVLSAIPNSTILLSPLITQEAVLSSRIEGTQATMGEVLEYEAEGEKAGMSAEKRDDIMEVLNYREAMRHAVNMLKELPLCLRIVLETHKILLNNVRGHGKSPGQYRRVPNWIGPAGCTMETARYVPISAERLPQAMGDWEKYIHGDAPDKLVQLAILHAEFEALHPFLDGNGRLGRMLIPLFLSQSGLIQSPMFYISAYFETHRDEYYERLLAVSRDEDWTGWSAFFLRAIQEQAEQNREKAHAILALYNTKKSDMVAQTHSQYAIHALDWIFQRPIFRSSDFVRSSSIPKPTASRILAVLKESKMLAELVPGRGRRAAVLAFSELLNIAEGRNAF